MRYPEKNANFDVEDVLGKDYQGIKLNGKRGLDYWNVLKHACYSRYKRG